MVNKRPKIHILYKFVEGPWGGGNQFLKALQGHFRKVGVYSENPEDAEVILFNSYPFGSEYLFDSVIKLKKRRGKILIHRVDGPISYVRGKDKWIDKVIFQFNDLFADGTIFQSCWSREMNYELGAKKSPYETVIMNAPDETIFCPEGKKPFNEERIKLVATSWSGNIRRGFEIYQYLDEHLDFEKYAMTFVGNSPIEFKNIRWIKPVPSRELANILKEHDIYITASQNDPCSNSLIEALHCGLPAVARNDGGHPEIIGKAGAFFEDQSDVIYAIEKVAKDYKHYQALINLPSLDEIGQKYYQFVQSIYKDIANGNYHPKQVNYFGSMRVRARIIQWKAQNILKRLKE
ncbi:MAG: glycosyltransferase family 1 protein [Candidatus Cloacimonadota bacterium]|nr:MAG: glycosyltransferase family 1 protein [Candidatus Cloacimonadota bacterium]